MRRLAIISTTIALLAIGFIAGTLYQQRQASPSPAPIMTPIRELGPGESIITFPESIEGTPEPNPQLTIKATVRDAITGEPVVATRVILGGKVIAEQVSEFEFTLPDEVLEYVYLEVQAPGYHQWKVGFRHQLSHSHTYPLPINIKPIPTTPPPIT